MLFPCCFGEQAGSFSQSLLLNSFHFGLKKGAEEKILRIQAKKTVDIGLNIVYTLMKKQLLVETVPGKTLGFQSLSKMFCILAIAVAVALSPESTGPLAPSAAQAQTTGNCGCTLEWTNPQDYGDNICGYQLTKDLNAALYKYCLEQCEINRRYAWAMTQLDSLEEKHGDSLGEFIDAVRELWNEWHGNRMYEAYMRLGIREGDAYQRYDDCVNWED